MYKTATFLITGVAALVLGGCSASGVNPTSPSRVCNLAANSLQLNVGTANLFGDTPAAQIIGTNVAVTYRQSASANCVAGDSGTLVNTPTLTVPAALGGAAGTPDAFGSTILTGPSTSELGTTSLTSIPQIPADTNNTALATTFGDDGGAFGLGLEPFNYAGALGTAGSTGKPASVFPYPVPLYDAIVAGGGTDPNQFLPGGGPPAFDPTKNTAATLGGFNGISEGLDVFEIAPAIGTYSLGLSIPANTGTLSPTPATAPITNVTLGTGLLPPVTPAVPGTLTAGGSLPFTYVLPAGVYEAYIQIVDIGPTTMGATSCLTGPDGSPASPTNPVYYTYEAAMGTTSGSLPAGSICTAAQNTTASGGTASDGDEFTVQTVGFDYDAFGASYPTSLGVVSPSLANKIGKTTQADITVSSQAEYTTATNIPTVVVLANRRPAVIHRAMR